MIPQTLREMIGQLFSRFDVNILTSKLKLIPESRQATDTRKIYIEMLSTRLLDLSPIVTTVFVTEPQQLLTNPPNPIRCLYSINFISAQRVSLESPRLSAVSQTRALVALRMISVTAGVRHATTGHRFDSV